jgi:putative FmdB family regulatory protein
MPIYEYKCQQCGAHIEVRQSVSDAPLTTCEKCHGRLEKQWSLSGFQFKGAGWYVTDYSKKGGNGSSSAEKSSSSESTAAAETASKPSSGSDKPSGGTDKKAAA